MDPAIVTTTCSRPDSIASAISGGVLSIIERYRRQSVMTLCAAVSWRAGIVVISFATNPIDRSATPKL
jgi:hypothetical protein